MWTPLAAIPPESTERFGNKCARLAEAHGAGLRVPESWALDVESAARIRDDEEFAHELARQLMGHAPRIEAWMLRSSSPLEDRVASSAAGLFLSAECLADVEELARVLARVVASAAEEAVLRLLGTKEPPPLAILAQPRLPLRAWFTAEIRPEEGLRLEGWRLQDAQLKSVWLELDPGEEPAPPFEELARYVAFARRAAAGTTSNSLLELGEAEDEIILLQMRPAPARAVAARSTPEQLSVGPENELPEDPTATHPFDEDRGQLWTPDLAHGPTPLCPLLAGLFQDWIRARGKSWPSRVLHGRWHDREAPARARGNWTDAAENIDALARAWETRVSGLEQRLDALAVAAEAMVPTSWPRFAAEWLEFQRIYFEGESGELRAWAGTVLSEIAQRKPPLPNFPLPETQASQRHEALQRLSDELRRFAGAHDIRFTSAQTIERFVHENSSEGAELRASIRVHRDRFAADAITSWDGRGRDLLEDAWPLWRELARRLVPTPARSETQTRAQREEQFCDALTRHPDARQLERAARAAAHALAHCENDDRLLARAYALFRHGARGLARELALSPRAEDEIFELLPRALARLIASPSSDEWARALRHGRALARLWDQIGTDQLDDEDPGRAGEWRFGRGAAPGTARGSVRRLASASALGGPRRDEILVVPAILPTDAVVFDLPAALIVESGDVLGHASILAREHALPSVVGLPNARRWLARARRVLVDGDSGRVTILEDEAMTDGGDS